MFKKLVVFTLLLVFYVSAKTLTIASYNVENLFDLKYDGTEYDIYSEKGGWNLSAYRAKLKNISFVISKINADIISLQEIGRESALLDLKRQLRRDGVRYNYSAFRKTGRQAVGLGVLSKYPIVNVQHYNVANSRPIMRTDIAVDGDTISFFSVHFPSKNHPESRRIRAANTVVRAIDSLAGRFQYVIMGDFNSDYDEFAKLLTQGTDDTKGKTGLNHILRTLRSGAGEKPVFAIPPLALGEHYNPWIEVAPSERWSYIFRGNRSTLDHILFPQNMTDTIGWRYVYGSFSHFLIPQIIKDGVPYRWQFSRAGRHYNSGFSDHLAIFAKITRENIQQEIPQVGEMGLNGWITNHSLANLTLAGRTPEGFAIYELSGKPIPSTASVARIVAVADRDYKTLEMAVRGFGNFVVRSRVNPTENTRTWNNTSPSTKEITGQPRYADFRSERWINIPLLHNVSAGDTVEIEIRIRQETPYQIQFCVGNLNGWYRHRARRR